MMAVAGGVGLPVPAVIAFERGSLGVLLMRHMPGGALRPAHGPQPVRHVGRLLRGLHALPAERKDAWDIHVSAWADQRTRQLVERHCSPLYRLLRHIGAAIWLLEHGMDGQLHINRMHQLLGSIA